MFFKPSPSKFEEGSLVRLVSGSPLMTVNHNTTIGVYCDWCDTVGAPHRVCFKEDQLRADNGERG